MSGYTSVGSSLSLPPRPSAPSSLSSFSSSSSFQAVPSSSSYRLPSSSYTPPSSRSSAAATSVFSAATPSYAAPTHPFSSFAAMPPLPTARAYSPPRTTHCYSSDPRSSSADAGLGVATGSFLTGALVGSFLNSSSSSSSSSSAPGGPGSPPPYSDPSSSRSYAHYSSSSSSRLNSPLRVLIEAIVFLGIACFCLSCAILLVPTSPPVAGLFAIAALLSAAVFLQRRFKGCIG